MKTPGRTKLLPAGLLRPAGPGAAQAGVGAPTPPAQTWVLSTVQIRSGKEAEPSNTGWGAEQR